jgi:KDO2-lipid IV(A) lauroyltransferase
MKLVDLLNTRYGVVTALAVARGTPKGLGYKIADWAASFLAHRRKTSLVSAVRLNQWVLSGKTLSLQELNRATRAVFRMQGRNFYDFYHNMDNKEAVLDLVRLHDSFQEIVWQRMNTGEGTMMVIPHLSNFDLAGRALAMMGMRFQILSYPITPGGYILQNRLRSESGLEVTPMNVDSMRRAKQRLKEGGLVLTGIDRPMDESNYPIRFCGYPANLPVSYARMAMQVNVPVVVIACERRPDGVYILKASPPMRMETEGELREVLIANAERVAAVAEQFIRANPHQWSMFYPVWPQFFAELPPVSEQPASQGIPEKIR